MNFRSDLLPNLRSYIEGHLILAGFRDLQLAALLDREKFSTEDQNILLLIDGAYRDLLAGTPEESFKGYLRSLIPTEFPAYVEPVATITPQTAYSVISTFTFLSLPVADPLSSWGSRVNVLPNLENALGRTA